MLSSRIVGASGAPAVAAAAVPAAPAGLVVGCELVAAVRALHQRDLRPDPEPPVGRALEPAETVLAADQADRPLTADVNAAAVLLDRFTEIWTDVQADPRRGSAS